MIVMVECGNRCVKRVAGDWKVERRVVRIWCVRRLLGEGKKGGFSWGVGWGKGGL